MKIREKLMDFKNRLSARHMYSIVVVTVALLCVVSAYQFKRAANYRNLLENQYHRSFSELVQYVNNIETSLAKSAVVTDPRSLVELANEINSRSAFATANLGQLPISQTDLKNTSKFLSQVGDFTHSIAIKHLSGGELTQGERRSLAQLSAYAAKLNSSLSKIQDEISAQTVRFGDIENTKSAFSKADKVMASEMENIEQQFLDYPSLIYDGPFSEHVENAAPKLIDGAKEITRQQAQERCAEIVGRERAGEIIFIEETGGKIPCYAFSVQPDPKDKNRSIMVEITKAGGALSWMLDTRFVPEEKISIKEAISKANACLVSLGIESMTESYYEIRSNIATINFAYTENDVIAYPDLIKIKVALDTGEILGIECSGYISNHHNRNTNPNIISETRARENLSPVVSVDGKGKLCYIPTDFASEILCYEFKANLDDKAFLIYINAETGKEEDVLMLLVSEYGTLTI